MRRHYIRASPQAGPYARRFGAPADWLPWLARELVGKNRALHLIVAERGEEKITVFLPRFRVAAAVDRQRDDTLYIFGLYPPKPAGTASTFGPVELSPLTEGADRADSLRYVFDPSPSAAANTTSRALPSAGLSSQLRPAATEARLQVTAAMSLLQSSLLVQWDPNQASFWCPSRELFEDSWRTRVHPTFGYPFGGPRPDAR